MGFLFTAQHHTLEMRHPVVRRVTVALLIIPSRLPNIPIPILIVLGAARLLEPLMLVASMVDNQVHEKLHTALVTALNQLLDVRDRAILIRDAVVVGNVVSHIDLG